MRKASRPFQIFVKPTGALCNLGCSYCYYLGKKQLYSSNRQFRMPDDILEAYIRQHIQVYPGSTIRFSWHGGEPTLLGLDYFRNIVEVQKPFISNKRHIINGIQSNGTLLTEEWCRFLAENKFSVGLSLDGPREMHDSNRKTIDGKPTHEQVMRGYHLLMDQGLTPDILCVVNADNVQFPDEVYGFFREIKAKYIGFLPMVERRADSEKGVTEDTVPPEAFGDFLCRIFDEWKNLDIGNIKVQIFEETAKTAFNEAHELCILRKTCGDVPVIEHNGDFFTCDHFVDTEHRLGNIVDTPLVDLLDSHELISFGQNKYDSLPRCCLTCEVLEMCNGECPKNRFIKTPDGEDGLNYLCEGYKSFFNHSRPFIRQLAALRQGQTSVEPFRTVTNRSGQGSKTGRNDPCPCGSGKKYKKCCLGR
jgi:uncharacterized protein